MVRPKNMPSARERAATALSRILPTGTSHVAVKRVRNRAKMETKVGRAAPLTRDAGGRPLVDARYPFGRGHNLYEAVADLERRVEDYVRDTESEIVRKEARAEGL